MQWRTYREVYPKGEHSVVGDVRVWHALRSPQLDNQRDILVYLPPSYAAGERRYPVLYMHDGQNLFDTATSFAGEWQVDETMQALSQEGLEAIVVGIPNAGEQRAAEYSPSAEWPTGGGRGQAYLRFVVETLKPLIDRDWRTLPQREHTGLLGSSLGGLISLFGFFEHAQTFGLAGVFSPAFVPNVDVTLRYVEAATFVPGRIYLDVGTREAASGRRQSREEIDESRLYLASAQEMRDALMQKGYCLQRDLLYVRERGGIHHESVWARRLPRALRFLLG